MHKFRMNERLWAAAPVALALALLGPLSATPALADARTESMSSYQRGFERFERGDYRGARIELLKAIKANPDNGAARLLQARVMLETGNGTAAQTEIERAIQAGVPVEKTRHLMAHALILQRQFQRALKEADAKTTPPQFAAYAARMRGRAQMSLNQPDNAKAEFELATRLSPNDVEAKVDLARFNMMQRNIPVAQQHIDSALAMEPTNVKALLLKGDIVRSTGGLAKSLPYFNQALQVDPNNIEALLERAATLGDLKRVEEAEADLKKVQGLAPDHPFGLYLQAVLAARAGNVQQANALMTRTKGTLNNYPPALLLQGILAYQLNNNAQANDFLAKVVAQVPNHALARKLYAATQLRKGDAVGAIDTLKPILDAGKADARTLALVGSAYARKGDFAEAQKHLEKAAAMAPGEESLRTQIAMTRVAQGDNEGAAADLQQVLKEDKNSLQALMMMSLINMREGKYREALGSANQIVKAYPKLPLGYNMRGAALLGMKDHKGAEAGFREALARKADYHEARRNLAQLLAATGRRNEAQRELLRILDQDRDDVRAMIGLSQLALANGNQKERIEWLRRAAGAKPMMLEPRLALMQAYVQTNQHDRALTESAALERDFPKNPVVIQAVGATQLVAKRAADAETTFNRLVTLAPTALQPRLLLARAQQVQNKTDQARSTLQRALTLTGQNLVPAYAELIALETRAKNLPGAQAVAKRMRAAYPKSSLADQLLGDAYRASGRLPEAIAAYEAARKIRFDRPVVGRLAGTYTQMKQPQKAVATLQSYIKANPRDPDALVMLADVHLNARQYRPAVAVYEQLHRQVKTPSAATLNNLAWAYNQLGDRRAIATAERAYKLAPKAAPVLDTYGWVLVNMKANPKRGLELLQQASKLSPNDPDIRYHLAVAYRSNGRNNDAIRELQAALKAPQFENAQRARQLLAQLR